MKLYEVNQKILDALDILEEEGGEINDTTTEVMRELDSLEMERDRILGYLAKVVLNTRSEAAALKAEEERLSKRRKALEKKEEKLIGILARECGEKTDLGVATLSYRKSESLDVKDAKAAVEWLNANGHADCVRTPAPEVMKDGVKKLLKAEKKVPGVALVVKNNVSLK